VIELAPIKVYFLLPVVYPWCDIIVLNVHASSEEKIDDIKDRFHEELEHVFDKFPKYHMKILLGDFNAKVRREVIFNHEWGRRGIHTGYWWES
jgi:hypothetical protein